MDIEIDCILDEPDIESLHPLWIDIEKKATIFSITKIPISFYEMRHVKINGEEVNIFWQL